MDDATVGQYGTITDALGGLAQTGAYLATLANGETANGDSAQNPNAEMGNWGLVGEMVNNFGNKEGGGADSAAAVATSMQSPVSGEEAAAAATASAMTATEEAEVAEANKKTVVRTTGLDTMKLQQAYLQSDNYQTGSLMGAESVQQLQTVRDLSGNLVAEGVLTSEEMNAIFAENPNALIDPIAFNDAVKKLTQSRSAAPPPPIGTPVWEQAAYQSYFRGN